MTLIKTTSAPYKIPPKPEDYLDYEDFFSVLTQYEADKLKNDISCVMHVSNEFQKTHLSCSNPYTCHQKRSICCQKIMDMRAEISEIERHQWRKYKHEKLTKKSNRMMSYPYRDENELVDDYLTQESASRAARSQDQISNYWKTKNSTNYSRNCARDYWNRKNMYNRSTSYY